MTERHPWSCGKCGYYHQPGTVCVPDRPRSVLSADWSSLIEPMDRLRNAIEEADL